MHPKAVHLLLISGALALLVALGAPPASAQFVDQTAAAGLTWYQTTWGAAFADLDGDGHLDLYAGHHIFVPVLHWNLGDGTFHAGVYPPPWSGLPDRHGTLAVPLDNDDRLDLFVTHGGAGGAGSEANELFRNDGPGALVSIPDALGLTDPDGRTRCVSGADYDDDTRVDLWVGKAPEAGSANSLFRNTGVWFFDEAANAGLDETEGTVGGIWGDVDDDGDPDLLTGGEEFTRPTRLWRNEGGTFVDASFLFSPALPVVSGADWGDLDGDGDLDLAVCDGAIGIFDTYAGGDSVSFFFNTRYADTGVDGLTIASVADTARALFRLRAFPDMSLIFLGPSRVHPPPGTVVTLTDEYVGAPVFDGGVEQGIFVWRTASGGDWEIRCSTPNVGYDNFDGWFADGTRISQITPVLLEDPGFSPGAPRVWRNDGAGFQEVSAALGLPSALVNPRDISWVDYDNDGDLDLHVVDMGTSAYPNAPDRLFRNDGAAFVNVTALEGMAGGTGGLGDGAVWGDVDRDGDLDVYVAQGAGPSTFSAFAPALFLRNDGERGHSIQLDLVGRGFNAAAVGTRVTAVTGTERVLRRVAANSWRGFQDPLRLHLGIGDAASADSLIVEWPSGRVDRYENVVAGVYRLVEGVSVLGVTSPALPPTANWRVEDVRPQPARRTQTLLVASGREVALVISVYDVAGRLVRDLHRGTVGPGTTSFPWNGRDAAGKRVAAGVYLLRVTDEAGRSATARSVRLD